LNLRIYQEEINILSLIQSFLGGSIHNKDYETLGTTDYVTTPYLREKTNSYYESSDFKSTQNIINYFYRFNLLSTKHIHFLK
jgi:hypothetical protein